ncbi:hypothetical protein EDC01DRAFT_287178 [Geopyxis carbonaria]|nr:hypothetical protein EDC01DRAFT_287178 [Geopyxis carbonaria]
MQFTLSTITAVLATLVTVSQAAPSPVETAESGCMANQYCTVAENFKECSPEWIAGMQACIKFGCLRWFADPLRNCEIPNACEE